MHVILIIQHFIINTCFFYCVYVVRVIVESSDHLRDRLVHIIIRIVEIKANTAFFST